MKTLLATTAGLILLCASIFATTAQSAIGPDSTSKTTKVPLRVSVAPKLVETGSPVKVAGGGGKGNRVKVQFLRNGGKKWQKLKTVPTDKKGRFKTSVNAQSSGAIRTRTSTGRVSRRRSIQVHSRLKVKLSGHQVKLGRSMLVRGAVKPRGRRWIKISITGAERRTIKTRSKSHGGFKVRFKPKRSGNFRIRVRSAGNNSAIGDTSRRLRVTGLRPVHASYYGPGLYGNGVACGGTLTPSTLGVAHKTLPCGTKVTLSLRGRTITVPVIDRGPYIAGRELDLTTATKEKLGFVGLGTVWMNR